MSQFPSRKYMRNPGFAHCAQAVRARHAEDDSAAIIDRPLGLWGSNFSSFLLTVQAAFPCVRWPGGSYCARFLWLSVQDIPSPVVTSLAMPLVIRRNMSRILICALAWDVQQGGVHDRGEGLLSHQDYTAILISRARDWMQREWDDGQCVIFHTNPRCGVVPCRRRSQSASRDKIFFDAKPSASRLAPL
jgi:hypothetical protein